MRSEIEVFKALGDENRVRIAMMLRERPMCVCEIDSVLDIALSTVSSHLKILKTSGIIRDKKDGRWVIYSINEENGFVAEILDIFEKKLAEDVVLSGDRIKLSTLPESVCTKYQSV
ncbi:ArsR/SmtB family transcription factor [Geovibrio ferrireducens]|uniref:ArsR/SmtB family transcription factor n=1 Tax=Geovibrio ferrireducens TaxID=46201 RepID=UPI0022469158|nr:metalloregulator ArsR/SmtB family transcription factor [Geovibrio ferrireducens]